MLGHERSADLPVIRHPDGESCMLEEGFTQNVTVFGPSDLLAINDMETVTIQCGCFFTVNRLRKNPI